MWQRQFFFFFVSFIRGVKSISRLWQINKIQTILFARALSLSLCVFVWFSHIGFGYKCCNRSVRRQTVIRSVFIGCTLGEPEHVKLKCHVKMKMETMPKSFTLRQIRNSRNALPIHKFPLPAFICTVAANGANMNQSMCMCSRRN